MDLQLTNEGKNSINRQNIVSVLTLSETGGKLTLIELSIAEKMHCFFQTHVLLTEQDKGKGMKVMDLGLSSNWAPGRDGRLPSHLGASHLLTRPFSRGIDGGQGHRLRAQNDVKFKVKRLKQTSMKEKRDLECKIWVNREPGAALTSERLSPRGGAKGLDTLGTRLDTENGDQRERSSRFRKYF